MDYIYIRAWEIHVGRSDSYIEEQVKLARQLGLPDDTIWIESNSKWYTMCHVYFGSGFAYSVPYCEALWNDVKANRMEPCSRCGKYKR